MPYNSKHHCVFLVHSTDMIKSLSTVQDLSSSKSKNSGSGVVSVSGIPSTFFKLWQRQKLCYVDPSIPVVGILSVSASPIFKIQNVWSIINIFILFYCILTSAEGNLLQIQPELERLVDTQSIRPIYCVAA